MGNRLFASDGKFSCTFFVDMLQMSREAETAKETREKEFKLQIQKVRARYEDLLKEQYQENDYRADRIEEHERTSLTKNETFQSTLMETKREYEERIKELHQHYQERINHLEKQNKHLVRTTFLLSPLSLAHILFSLSLTFFKQFLIY